MTLCARCRKPFHRGGGLAGMVHAAAEEARSLLHSHRGRDTVTLRIAEVARDFAVMKACAHLSSTLANADTVHRLCPEVHSASLRQCSDSGLSSLRPALWICIKCQDFDPARFDNHKEWMECRFPGCSCGTCGHLPSHERSYPHGDRAEIDGSDRQAPRADGMGCDLWKILRLLILAEFVIASFEFRTFSDAQCDVIQKGLPGEATRIAASLAQAAQCPRHEAILKHNQACCIGCEVEVTGLQHPFADKNGLRGQIVSWSGDTKKWEVLSPEGRRVLMSEKFLKVISIDNSLRFKTGDEVACKTGRSYARGRVIKLSYREFGWPQGMLAPYQVELRDGSKIYAPKDDDSYIRSASNPWPGQRVRLTNLKTSSMNGVFGTVMPYPESEKERRALQESGRVPILIDPRDHGVQKSIKPVNLEAVRDGNDNDPEVRSLDPLVRAACRDLRLSFAASALRGAKRFGKAICCMSCEGEQDEEYVVCYPSQILCIPCFVILAADMAIPASNDDVQNFVEVACGEIEDLIETRHSQSSAVSSDVADRFGLGIEDELDGDSQARWRRAVLAEAALAEAALAAADRNRVG